MLHRKYVYIFAHCNFEECVEFGSGLLIQSRMHDTFIDFVINGQLSRFLMSARSPCIIDMRSEQKK